MQGMWCRVLQQWELRRIAGIRPIRGVLQGLQDLQCGAVSLRAAALYVLR